MRTRAEAVLNWAEHKLAAMEGRADRVGRRGLAAAQGQSLLAEAAALFADQSNLDPIALQITAFTCPSGPYVLEGVAATLKDALGTPYAVIYTDVRGNARGFAPPGGGHPTVDLSHPAWGVKSPAPIAWLGDDFGSYAWGADVDCYPPCPSITLQKAGYALSDWAGTSAAFEVLDSSHQFDGLPAVTYPSGVLRTYDPTVNCDGSATIAAAPGGGTAAVLARVTFLWDGWDCYLHTRFAGCPPTTTDAYGVVHYAKYVLGVGRSFFVDDGTDPSVFDALIGPAHPTIGACDPFALSYDFGPAIAAAGLADPFQGHSQVVTLSGTNL